MQQHYSETELGPDVYPVRIAALEIQRVTVAQGQLLAEGSCDVAVSYRATADFDLRDEPDTLSLSFTASLDLGTNQFLFENIQLVS